MLKFACAAALSLAVCGVVSAADSVEIGKAKAEAVCSECHEKSDWADQDAATIKAKIHKVVAGTTKHKKKLTLTDEEMAGIARYWAGITK